MEPEGPKNRALAPVGNEPDEVEATRLFWEREYAKMIGFIKGVGPSKPIGSLYFEQIVEAGEDPYLLKEEAEGKNLRTAILSDTTNATYRANIEAGFGAEMSPPRNSLYVFDEQVLQTLLDNNREIVEAYGWSCDPRDFVQNVHDHHVPNEEELARVVHEAFGDTVLLEIWHDKYAKK